MSFKLFKLFSALLAALPAAFIVPAGAAGSAQSGHIKTIVLVHGAWADANSYSKVIPLLLAQGLHVIAVENPVTSLADDVAFAKRAIDQSEGPVLLVGHSWAGAVITQVGVDPKVAGIVYIAAYAPDVGESVSDAAKPFPLTPVHDGGVVPFGEGAFVLTPEAMRMDFVPESSPDEIAVQTVTQGWVSGAIFTDKVTVAAWKEKPTWYIVAGNDRVISPDAERAFAKRMNATTLVLPSSHVVMLGHPKEVADFIISAVKRLAH
jgi:pimeloyl-ACP methyl ester carboxylesterase